MYRHILVRVEQSSPTSASVSQNLHHWQLVGTAALADCLKFELSPPLSQVNSLTSKRYRRSAART